MCLKYFLLSVLHRCQRQRKLWGVNKCVKVMGFLYCLFLLCCCVLFVSFSSFLKIKQTTKLANKTNIYFYIVIIVVAVVIK